ncbi:2-succinyl-5-enolpyruvyl-6-hydroxy-3-cyclohexene-1-carboxylic-acid synthase [Metabacillus herbersteinensis]|uniref:2-succinyl-5-enolpyruvyl-6-hydroxy-3-cyclohexene-1-carboxylate synthase n=1 Tax=Metabacillus herbersteinensis TaxID=283816 RepID=A0ABV6GJX4_9BACI
MKESDSLTLYISSFVDELAGAGVESVVISPGSRSTPLAILMAEHPDLTCYLNIDERSAGFFALGMAKVQRKPVVLLCTSGTATANYYPAIVEAHYSRVPLLVLTADRPHELRDVGAPQAIDQLHMYGKYAKWFVDLALPEQSESMLGYARTVSGRAVATALSKPAGVVHLNFPLREPLLPNLQLKDLWKKPNNRETHTALSSSSSILSESELKRVSTLLKDKKKGLIVCGELSNDKVFTEIIQFSKHFNFPLLADPLSQMRTGTHDKETIIDKYDTFLKDEVIVKELMPDVVIRFGAMPVSKPLFLLLKNHPEITQIIVDEDGGWRDPTLNATQMVNCNEKWLCRELISNQEKQGNSTWRKIWTEVNNVCSEHLHHLTSNNKDLFEGKIYVELQKYLPDESTVFVGNSMPIRDVDTFFSKQEKRLNILANRGANGIDGVVSTALGSSVKNSHPTYLIIGDLSFFHDLNGLLAAKMYELNLTIILINNDGGGIFSFLPQASEEKHFEQLFGTAIGLDFSKAIEMYHGSYRKVETWEQFQDYFSKDEIQKGLNVVEIVTNRQTRVKVHRDLMNCVSQEIRKTLLNE